MSRDSKSSKRMRAAKQMVKGDHFYSLSDALGIIAEYAIQFKAKFDETVDVVLKLGVDPRYSDQIVRGVVAMPNGLGKSVKVAVVTKVDRVEEARIAGADIYGAEDLMEEIKAGYTDFDVCIATPDVMSKMATLGKVLGPKGLMPNPKLGTVSDDIFTSIKTAKSGQVEYKVEKSGIIHAGAGKLSFTTEMLRANILALYNAVLNAKPSGVKGIYMRGMFLTTTHGPSLKLDLRDISS